MITLHFHLQPQYNMNFIYYISQNNWSCRDKISKGQPSPKSESLLECWKCNFSSLIDKHSCLQEEQLRHLNLLPIQVLPHNCNLLEGIISSCLLDCTHYSHANSVKQWNCQKCHGKECYHTQECVHCQRKQQHQIKGKNHTSLLHTLPVDQIDN